jgi:hypothetical protein
MKPTFTDAAEDDPSNLPRMDSLVGLANAWIDLASMVYTDADS